MAGIADIYYTGGHDFAEVYQKELGGKPLSAVSVFQAKNIGFVELCELGVIFGLGSFDDMMGQFKNVFVDEDAGCGAMLFPEALVSRIKSLNEAELAATAQAWVQSEHFQHILSISSPPPAPTKKKGLFSMFSKPKTPPPPPPEPENKAAAQLTDNLTDYLTQLQAFLKTRNEPAYLFMSP